MEKVMFTLRRDGADDQWCARLRTEVANRVLDAGVPGLAVNVRDAPVRASLMTLTTLDPPVVAVVSVWTHSYHSPELGAVRDLLAAECAEAPAYLVTESVPLPPPSVVGARTDGLANVALLRRPPDLDERTWLTRWHVDHTPVAIATQDTSGYVQNTVVRPLTDGAPRIDAIVEELFPLAAVADLHAFFGAADDADLSDRMQRMLASTGAFGADRDVDTVPTSRYVLRSPFAADA
ncbi:EthD domain-containing protein [Mycolicibacterium sp. F2034L]|uniref:EthD domain-containing protein n=1 Tax=Mycolicibacterium sp. F2034L TaxID=2926422 RepID=UPI001FF42754|nr:EthD domain-containing protein [Mycolicibacterium sp. F2034L]MCK0174099.1 EthD domain-containing protein [Mycolicibacterium sp. F2034L]